MMRTYEERQDAAEERLSPLQPVLDLAERIEAEIFTPGGEGTQIHFRTTPQMLKKRLRVEQLPYTLTCAYLAALELEGELSTASDLWYMPPTDGPAAQLIPDSISASWKRLVDSYLDAARRCQNALLAYVQPVTRGGVMMSLPKELAKVRNRKSGIPSDVAELLLAYWDQDGWILRWYRDKTQHYAVVAGDVSLFRASADKPINISFFLPDTPTSPDDHCIEYDLKTAHALQFVLDSFIRLLDIVAQTLSLVCGKLELQAKRSVVVVKGTSFGLPPYVGHEPLAVGTFSDLVRRRTQPYGLA